MDFRSKITQRILPLTVALHIAAGTLSAQVREVGSRYLTLSDAIRSARPHDTIRVHAGNYPETGLIVDKPLTIVGIGGPVIDARGNGEIFTVESDSVTFIGLTLRNSGISYVQENAAVKIKSARHCRVIDNRFEGNFFAVYLSKSSDCQITGNTITSTLQRESSSGNGIHLWDCKNITIRGNRISGHRDGIYFEFSARCTIETNESFENLRYGLHFMFSDSCVYRNNLFIRNSAGVAVMYTHHIVMEGNRFEQNWGAASFGILLKDISASRIADNRFVNNSVGLYAEGCNRNNITGNTFESNGWGMRIMANSTDNRIVDNNFISNTFEVTTNSRTSHNVFDRNYWSDYSGYDLDRDGIGDVPHRPVRLFSVLIDKYPGSLILLRSALQNILEMAERFLPVLTPASLMDAHPRMTRIS